MWHNGDETKCRIHLPCVRVLIDPSSELWFAGYRVRKELELILRSIIWDVGGTVTAIETEILGHDLFKRKIIFSACSALNLKFP